MDSETPLPFSDICNRGTSFLSDPYTQSLQIPTIVAKKFIKSTIQSDTDWINSSDLKNPNFYRGVGSEIWLKSCSWLSCLLQTNPKMHTQTPPNIEIGNLDLNFATWIHFCLKLNSWFIIEHYDHCFRTHFQIETVNKYIIKCIQTRDICNMPIK